MKHGSVDDGRRLVFKGLLIAETPLHVGSGGFDTRTDSPVVRAEDGFPMVPASSLAGSIRSHLVTVGHPGWRPLIGEHENALQESPLWVDHAFLSSLGAIPAWVRDRVGIDRVVDTARDQILFDHEIVPAGVKFDLRLEYRRLWDDEEHSRALDALLYVLNDLQVLGLQVGGKQGIGLGRFTLQVNEVIDVDLSDGAKLDAWLDSRDEDPAVFPRRDLSAYELDPAVDPATPQVADVLRFDVRITSSEPLLIAGTEPLNSAASPGWYEPRDPQEADRTPSMYPLLGADGAWRWEPFIPGSSLRGALRARCEMIARTLAVAADAWAAACDPFSLDSSCSARVIASEKAAEPAPPDAAGMHADACIACRVFGHSRLAGRVRVLDAVAPGAAIALREHIAVDRVAGSTAGDRKFDDAPVSPGAEFVARIEIRDPDPTTVALLLLALRDLADGDLQVGAARGRGYGEVTARVEDIVLLEAHAGSRGLQGPREDGSTRSRVLLAYQDLAEWASGSLVSIGAGVAR